MLASVMRFIVMLLFVGGLFVIGCGENSLPERTLEDYATKHQTKDSPILKQISEVKEVVDSGTTESSEIAHDSSTMTVTKQEENDTRDTVTQEKNEVPADSVKKVVPVKGNSDECGDVTKDRIKAGATVFSGNGNCSTCHKGDGTGTPLGPDLTDQTWINISGDYSSIIENVRNGVQLPIEHPTPMPPMGGGTLTEEEICAVAAYVWSLSH